MAKSESFALVSTIAFVASVIFLILAVYLSFAIRPPSPSRSTNSRLVSIANPLLQKRTPKQNKADQKWKQCYRTCRLELVESLPENLTFIDSITPPLASTYESWQKLIRTSEKKIIMAAYKSSFRGKHVLPEEHLASGRLGDDIFESLRKAASERNIRLEAVENYPPKDRGDNEDVGALAELGLMDRRRVHVNGGVMHSKFLISDDRHFYLGSANFDWRSLNQKMELGVHVENCPCLADDLKVIYNTYRTLDFDSPALTSKLNPLLMRVGEADTEVYLAASPRQLSGTRRDWDLDAIVDLIDASKYRLDINVMDYVPMFVYYKEPKFWPVIDDALLRAVVDRGVHVRFLTAALHFASESLHALKSLQIAGQTNVNGGRVEVKILNVPAVTEAQKAFARERRTHRKFVVTDDSLLIGTSNWSGDYFANTTGVAIVMRQKDKRKPLIDQARQLFERDWKSKYVSDLDDYIARCYDRKTKKDFCKAGRMAYQEA